MNNVKNKLERYDITNEDTRAREETIIDSLSTNESEDKSDTYVQWTTIGSESTKIDGKISKRSCEWLDDIKDWCGRSGQDLLHVAQDRRMWKKLIRTVVGPNGR